MGSFKAISAELPVDNNKNATEEKKRRLAVEKITSKKVAVSLV